MRVVLFQSVPNVGLAGDIVDVKPGFYRNYLEPRGYAMRETPGALRLLSSKKKKIEQVLLKERSQAEEAEKAISAIELSFRLKAGEKGRLFGSVTNRDIADALNAKGVEVDRHKIELPESIKTVGSHKARVRLHPHVVAELTVMVEPDQVVAVEAQSPKAEKTTEAAEAAPTESVAETASEPETSAEKAPSAE